MFLHSIRSAIVIAFALSEIALGASTSGRRTLELSPRQFGPGPHFDDGHQFGGGQQMSSSSYTYESQVIVAKWSAIPAAFAQCQSVFQQRVEAAVAIQAVQRLYYEIQSISQYRSCSCQSDGLESHSAEFQRIVSETFTSWQNILTIGREIYASEWEYSFRSEFEKFSSFVQTVQGLCASLRIDLSGLLVGLNLNVGLFVGVNVNLNVILGGALGTVGNAVNGLVGGATGLVGSVTGSLLGGQGHGLLGLK